MHREMVFLVPCWSFILSEISNRSLVFSISSVLGVTQLLWVAGSVWAEKEKWRRAVKGHWEITELLFTTNAKPGNTMTSFWSWCISLCVSLIHSRSVCSHAHLLRLNALGFGDINAACFWLSYDYIFQPTFNHGIGAAPALANQTQTDWLVWTLMK